MKKMHSFLKVILTVFLMIALLVSAAGCTGGETEPTGKEKLPKQTEATEPSQRSQGLAVEQLRQQMSAENKTFALAIVDGQLVIRNYFEVDGAPGVSYETFQAVG